MITITTGIAATVLYLTSLGILASSVSSRRGLNQPVFITVNLLGGGLHLVTALLLTFRQDLVDFSLFSSGSLIFAVIQLIVTLSSVKKPVHTLLLVIQPLSAILLLLSLFTEPTKLTNLSSGVSLHVLFSILAYGVVTIAAACALALWYASYSLKHKKIGNRLLPPLETADRLLFEMLLVGEILLSISIISGFLYIEDILGQKLSHKTFFSVLSWTIFAMLLAGHRFFGWRGTKAIKWTLSGFVALLIAYAGSKVVLELILN